MLELVVDNVSLGIEIRCPLCRKKQLLDYKAGIYYPIGPFCCQAMATLDDDIWNKKLDKEIKNALRSSSP